ncbi:hypothetical protein [Mesorhizobium sp. M0923]
MTVHYFFSPPALFSDAHGFAGFLGDALGTAGASKTATSATRQ